MQISQIVAVAQNGAIGKDNDLIWRLPADLKFFKNTTTGHHMLLGRKNYDSIGRPLPNRVSLIISRNTDYVAEGAEVFSSIEDAIQFAKDEGESELFIVGGAQIYEQTMDLTTRIYYTEVHESFDGDCFYDRPDEKYWKEISREDHQSDEKNPYDYSFVVYERI